MSNLIQKYFKATTIIDAKSLNKGQLVWGASQFLPRKYTTVELTHYEPTDERRNRYAILPDPPPDLVFNHTPVHELGLEHNEELLVIQAKMRKMVVLTGVPELWQPGASRLQEKTVTCLPLYSFKPEENTQFRNRVKSLEYPWWIYIPEDEVFKVEEGFIRLDRIQQIEKNLLKLIPVALNEDALYFLSE